MRTLILTAISFFLFSSLALADSGLVSIKSSHPVKETADRLEKSIGAKGLTLFKRIDHSAGAREAGQKLRPTQLLIFGDPKVGTPLMQCGQTMAIDLPQKVLVWQDEEGQVWFSYNEPEYLAKRHGIRGCLAVIKKVQTVLANFAQAATAP
ncbi:MAG: DUF302 domain-containing protein [Thermodesulfobacteriota bacterium]